MEEKVCIYCGEKIEEGQLYVEDSNGNCYCSYECLEKHYNSFHEDSGEEIQFNINFNVGEKKEEPKNDCPCCSCCGKPIKKGRNIYVDKNTNKYYCTLKCLAKAYGAEWEQYKRV